MNTKLWPKLLDHYKYQLHQVANLPFSSWGAAVSDFNNDGYEDVYVANGLVKTNDDTSHLSQGQDDTIWLNQGDIQFIASKGQMEAFHPYSSRGVVKADFDNDGRSEIVVSNNNNQLQILKNQKQNLNNWLGIEVKNQHEYSQFEIVLTTENKVFKRKLSSPQSFLSQSDKRLIIGLGSENIINKLVVQVKGKNIIEVKSPNINRYYKIDLEKLTIDEQEISKLNSSHIYESYKNLRTNEQQYFFEIWLGLTPQQRMVGMDIFWKGASIENKKQWMIQIKHKVNKRDWQLDNQILGIIKFALNDKDEDVRLRAILLLGDMELNESVEWLLPLISDQNENIQCAVAKVFGLYFDEEEAVIHKKYLALSPLIKQLDDNSNKTLQCVIRALAKSENKRAVRPLIQLIKKQNQYPEIQKQAVNALGKIRDTQVVPFIESLLNQKKLDAEVIGASIMALSRLNALTAKDYFTKTNKGLLMRFKVLYQLSKQAKGILISKSTLNKIFKQLENEFLIEKIFLSQIHASKIEDVIGELKALHQPLKDPTLVISKNLCDTKNLEVNLKIKYWQKLDKKSKEKIIDCYFGDGVEALKREINPLVKRIAINRYLVDPGIKNEIKVKRLISISSLNALPIQPILVQNLKRFKASEIADILRNIDQDRLFPSIENWLELKLKEQDISILTKLKISAVLINYNSSVVMNYLRKQFQFSHLASAS